MTRTPGTSALVSDQLELYRRMWVLRLLDMALEESRIDGLLDGPMQAGFGQEAAAVGTVAALRPGDTITTTISRVRHARRVGLALPLGPAIAEMIDPNRGADDGAEESPFVADWKHGLLSASSALAQSVLFALGDAYAQRLAGAGEVTLFAIEGCDANSVEFKVAANIALSWQFPVVFVVENIRGAASSRQDSHGMTVLSVDGNDVEAVRDLVSEAAQRAGAGEGPILVEAVTDRTNAICGVDPLVSARQRLAGAGVSGSHLYEVERRARHLVAEAESFARAMLRAEEPALVREPEPWPAVS
jgi:TPP-dependent pyruvate/acetoin dehydrogenase alpha subunit